MNEPMNAGGNNSMDDCKCNCTHGGMCKPNQKCGCPHHKVIPALILLIGLDILLGAVSVFDNQTMTVIVAILLILIGGTKMFSHKCRCCHRHC